MVPSALSQRLARRTGARRLLWITTLHAIGLYLFTTGFFLTRFEVPDVSECHRAPQGFTPTAAAKMTTTTSAHLRHEEASHDPIGDARREAEGCWMPQRYRRVVFVVIDALRFDFVVPPTSPSSPPSSSSTPLPSFYWNQLPILNATLHAEPAHTALFKFVADAPTMTMQRLKGLTTGSLPTFLDIKDNMASSAITEDNLIRQMHDRQRGIVFMGDDTWQALYARYFTRAYAFDSFNVKDLHTVDRGVERHLFPELGNEDWDLLIAHLLGVDHVGHTHGPSSVHMTDKLRDMNALLTRLLTELPQEDTLLLVMGDHGMSPDGNHGGASDDETGAALFMYSKEPLVSPTAMQEQKQGQDEATEPATTPHWSLEVPQVDLVPTLALLSGLPIPFGNLGAVIPQLFFFSDASHATQEPPSPVALEEKEKEELAAFQSLTQALRLNVHQVRRYLWTYSSASKLPASEYDHLETLFTAIAALDARVLATEAADMTESVVVTRLHLYEELSEKQHAYLREALLLGRSIWTQFDFSLMSWGVLLLIIGQWLLGHALWGSLPVAGQAQPPPRHQDASLGRFPVVGSAGGLTVICLLPAAMPWLPRAIASRALLGLALGGTLDLLMGTGSTSEHHKTIKQTGSIKSRPSPPPAPALRVPWWRQVDIAMVVASVVGLLHVLALLSNSFIVAEDRVVHFLSATVACVVGHASYRQPPHQGSRRRVRGMASALLLLFVTRILTALEPPNIIRTTTSVSHTWAPLTVVVASSLIVFARASWPVVIRWYAMASVLISGTACAFYWAYAPVQSWLWRLWLPRAVFLVLVLAMFRCARWPTSHEPTSSAGSRWALPPFALLLPLVQLAYALVLGPTSPLPTLGFLVQSLCLATCARCCFPSSSAPPLSWVLLFWTVAAYQSFFASGHQSTFTSLQNAAGFVGMDEFQFYWAGALLALNTFGNLLLALLGLAFMVWWRPQRPTDHPRNAFAFAFAWRRASLGVVAVGALHALVSTLFVALQRRHLMVWAIFAPKFIFDGVTLLVMELLALGVAMLVGENASSCTNALIDET